MMSNDTAQLQRFLQIAGYTLAAPLQIIVALGLIYQQVCMPIFFYLSFQCVFALQNK